MLPLGPVGGWSEPKWIPKYAMRYTKFRKLNLPRKNRGTGRLQTCSILVALGLIFSEFRPQMDDFTLFRNLGFRIAPFWVSEIGDPSTFVFKASGII